ncbi:DUF5651 domain-containing protein [Clostridium butyricum]|uniref:DUF5651 domain-containing protein n=1 Tax=Clostridium butyricum TaxID=1492 RepID=UPI0013D58BFC|nr:DUF5651 domain-containing protein [Clostridium butyricum]MCQ2016774.1 DUF5651 domain-containing protein [Clostridium butyricum]MCQ2020664.1 DUF5651 domain-containing protein [Clostridium butyricum]NFB69571.1 hypothetical protein [Clostridium butyricum]NFB90374.1 hypothetical protein [Clostridium butyricum]UTY54159.1 hypothetical protein HNS01_14025 [Clostridium butyricum]
MKDYLNNQEVKEALILTYCKILVQHFVDGNVMTKEEKTNLKKGGTFIKNSLKSMIQRLGESSAKKYVRLYENSRITVMTNSELEVLAKRKDAELNAAYEDSKEYFDLVELTMDCNCKDCCKDWKQCNLCNHFDNNEIIPFYDGYESEVVKDLGNCKYAYRSDDVEKKH